MVRWLIKRIFRRGFHAQREALPLGALEELARGGTAAWLLAQERARLDYLAAQEDYTKSGSWAALGRLLVRLLRLSSTNALVQSLLNEHALERQLTLARKETPSVPARRSA
jgi:hypothetical protein